MEGRAVTSEATTPADAPSGGEPVGVVSLRYPESVMPMAAELPERWQRFAELREELLLDYGYHTARAYWGDLQDVAAWADERGKDILTLAEKDVRQYLALLRRRRYSPSTVRRRLTSLRAFYGLMVERGERDDDPAVAARRRRRASPPRLVAGR